VPRQRGAQARGPAATDGIRESPGCGVSDQLACLENIPGDRELPDHPLVNQTIDDCLTEAMDIEDLEELLRNIEQGQIRCVARDLLNLRRLRMRSSAPSLRVSG
jgi:ATP-dependent Lhr-like helicase